MRKLIALFASKWPREAHCFWMNRDLPIKHQPKLLRVLETGEFERVGSSKDTSPRCKNNLSHNADLNEEVSAGRFRQDLLFRLNTVEIHLPPLRDRREDIPLLATHFSPPAPAPLPQGISKGFIQLPCRPC